MFRSSFLLKTVSLASLFDSWAKRGLGYLIDRVAYAGDVVLLARSTADLQILFKRLKMVSHQLDWLLSQVKTNFASTVACEGAAIVLSGHVVKLSLRLTSWEQ